MDIIYQHSYKFIDKNAKNGIFVEIGCDRGVGSTKYFADLAQENNTILHAVDILPNARNNISHPAIEWHISDGATWCRNHFPLLNQKISLLYLDNFDYIFNDKVIHDPWWTKERYDAIKGESWPSEFLPFQDMPDWIKQEIIDICGGTESEILGGISGRYKDFGFEFSNNNCQIEHLKQLLLLYPYFTQDCLIIFDDTFTVNDCWIGKNGPGVVFLQTQGFKIVYKDHTGVIMKQEKTES
jgi:hypothetical protein